jgi:hypothetical protein
MSTYEFLLFAHILFVAAWVGTDIGLQVLAFRTLGAGPERTVTFTADIEWLGTRFLVPSSLLVIVFGIPLANNVGAGRRTHTSRPGSAASCSSRESSS